MYYSELTLCTFEFLTKSITKMKRSLIVSIILNILKLGGFLHKCTGYYLLPGD